MPEHMDMNGEAELTRFTCSLDHAGDAHAIKRLAALIDKNEARFQAGSFLIFLQSFETNDFITFQIMRAVHATLEAPDDDCGLTEIDISPAKITRLTDAQSVTINHEPDQPIPLPMAIFIESAQQLGNLAFSQMLARPVSRVCRSPSGNW